MTVYKKKNPTKNPWFCKFSYKDIKGITHQKKKEGFRTRKQALEYQENFLNEANSRPISCFKDLIQLYIADKTNNVKPLTLKKITSVTSKYIRPYFIPLYIFYHTFLFLYSFRASFRLILLP